ncbi:MAG TPA: LOG family protein [Phycisphaerae bacterium]|nr:LOG family protein [Phycisphaerae bacterium]HPS53487.1 LOG family protein [Phycisphaerae bacterium]
MTAKIISVFGANDGQSGDEAYEQARSVGKFLAERGYAIANGGYGGTMQAAAAGAKSAGGTTYGVVCDIWQTPPNDYIDHVVRTSTYMERLQTLIDFGKSGYVVLPGATGTLMEAAMVWEHACKRFWEKADQPSRPIAFIGDFWLPLRSMMTQARPGCEKYVAFLSTADELTEIFPAVKVTRMD